MTGEPPGADAPAAADEPHPLATGSRLKLVAVCLLATGPLAAFVAELSEDRQPWLLLVVSLFFFGAVAGIFWKWPRAGGVLLLLASAAMFFAWEEQSSWTLSDLLWMVFLAGVPFTAGALFLVAGYRSERSPAD